MVALKQTPSNARQGDAAFVETGSTELSSSRIRVGGSSSERRLETANVTPALAQLYARHRDQVYRLALRYANGEPPWAEDVTQEVFLTVLKKLPELDELGELGGWFYRVTTNHCLKRLRQDRVRRSAIVRWLFPAEEAEHPSPEEGFLKQEAVTLATAAMAALPPKERVAFSMYRLDGKSQPEIAATLGLTKGYVCKLIQHAEAKLAQSGWEVQGD